MKEEARPGQIRIGTSGWVYPEWRGTFYPHDLPAKGWFAYYAAHFDTVEVNNTFYQMPAEQTVRKWAQQAPEGFIYALKANRIITHTRRLKDPEEPLAAFLDRARALAGHLGPILYQLPPHWSCNPDRLRAFLRLLPAGRSHVFEFRDPSWYTEEVRTLLTEAGAGFCIHDLYGTAAPCWLTSNVVYIRFHGPTHRAYTGRYPQAQLRLWAQRIEGYREAGLDVYVYFNNTAGDAVNDAQRLKVLLGQSVEMSC